MLGAGPPGPPGGGGGNHPFGNGFPEPAAPSTPPPKQAPESDEDPEGPNKRKKTSDNNDVTGPVGALHFGPDGSTHANGVRMPPSSSPRPRTDGRSRRTRGGGRGGPPGP